ncbi:glycoside hydrolase family 19 protein [Polyangium sp. 15x6]|uniref:glycoside hydrolase family 19 protein n=1 Tax=Polyangium sp. 15x6 TaxID=3042687 RepID=UPI00249C2BAD|nr:glycoside hydrolase family 19 protein [Polyangium sp. 15x6]MDI3282204.1 glycoside hydrolase family 19 protein [Polyangium sp. 15x6]
MNRNRRRAVATEGSRVTGGDEISRSEDGPRPCAPATETGTRKPTSLIEYVPGYQRPRGEAAAPMSRLPGRRVEETPDRFLVPERFAREGAMLLREPTVTPAPTFTMEPENGGAGTVIHAVPVALFGDDDRVLVSPTDVEPFRAICALRLTGTNGAPTIGTGWLIDSRTVITAGHCVYDCQKMGGWAVSAEVIPALDASRRPFGSVRATRFRTVSAWLMRRFREYDYGAILLDEPVQLEEGFFVPEALSDAALTGILANIAGYPENRENATRIFFHARELRDTSARLVQYDIDTYGGQSGAPVWVTRPDGRRTVVGIHTSGPDWPIRWNFGVRITAEVLENLRRWSEEAATPRRRRLPAPTRGASAPASSAESATLEAGTTTREITGKVVDAAMRPLADVTVTISSQGAPTIATTSTEDGSFSLPMAKPGRHALKAFSSRGASTKTVTSEQEGPVTLVIESQPEAPTGGTEAGVVKPAAAPVKKPAKKPAVRAGVTLAELRAIMPRLPVGRARACLPHLNKAMKEAAITTKKRIAAFLAQLAHESGELRHFEELGTGKSYEGRKDLGNVRPGDGPRFKGRGPIQITGRSNYRAAGKALGIDLEKNPKCAARLDVGFRIAGWFWKSRKLNALADRGDFKKITYRINGGYRGLARRRVYYQRALRVLG